MTGSMVSIRVIPNHRKCEMCARIFMHLQVPPPNLWRIFLYLSTLSLHLFPFIFFLVFLTAGWFYFPPPAVICNIPLHLIPMANTFIALCLTSSQISAIFVKYLSKPIEVFGLLLKWVKYWRAWRQDLTSLPSNPRLFDVHSYCSTTAVLPCQVIKHYLVISSHKNKRSEICQRSD